MIARTAALAAGGVSIASVGAQDVVPGVPLYHTWPYALALTLALVALAAYAVGARRGADGAVGRRLLVAVAGAAVIDVAGLASGLFGPDTVDVVGTPGTVLPLPALGAAAFFGAVDAGAIARGDADIVLRRRSGGEVRLTAGAHRPFGESVLAPVPRPAAYVEVHDERGGALTVTQPTNAAFLSPVLLFRDRQRIGTADVPLDTFAVPARHRVVRALAFTPQQLAGARGGDPGRPALVLSVADDAGRPLGISLAPTGETVAIARLRIRATVGTYPALAIASAPVPWALALGIALIVAGIGWDAWARRQRAGARGAISAGARPER